MRSQGVSSLFSRMLRARAAASVGVGAQLCCGFLRSAQVAGADARARRRADDGVVRSALIPDRHRPGARGRLGLRLAGEAHAGRVVFAAVLLAVIVPLAYAVARRLLRGQLGADVIGLLASPVRWRSGELAAGLVVALMLSGGELLDQHAFRRARRELAALAQRAPATRTATSGTGSSTCRRREVQAGDRLRCSPARSCPSTARSRAIAPCSTRRR